MFDSEHRFCYCIQYIVFVLYTVYLKEIEYINLIISKILNEYDQKYIYDISTTYK